MGYKGNKISINQVVVTVRSNAVVDAYNVTSAELSS